MVKAKLPLRELLKLIKNAPKNIELALTGRFVPNQLIQAADLVSEVKEVKHYYAKGVQVWRGIEF